MGPIKKNVSQTKRYQKWKEEDVLQILKYIQKEGKLESPTAKFFYNKFLEETKINTTWRLLKSKVRYLRHVFQKTLNWKNKYEAGLNNEDIEIINMEKKLHQLCPHYNILSDIFSEKYDKNFEFNDTGSDVLSKNSLPSIEVGQIEDVYNRCFEMFTRNNENSYNREPNATEVNDTPSTSDCSNKKDRPEVKLKKTVVVENDGIKKKKTKIKWKNEELLQILKYIQKEGNLGKPTARIYYRKCLEETKIKKTWEIVRWKMIHLRRRFQFALNWKNKYEAGLINEDIEIINMEKKLDQLCPHYNILSEIFSEKYVKKFEFYDTGSDVLLKNSLPSIDVGQIGEVEMFTTNNENSYNRESNAGNSVPSSIDVGQIAEVEMFTTNNENSYNRESNAENSIPSSIDVGQIGKFEMFTTNNENSYNRESNAENSIPSSIDVGQIAEVEMFTTNNENSYNREPNAPEVNDTPSTSDCSNKKDRPEVKLKKTIPETAIEQLVIINKERNEILKLKIEAEKLYNEKKMHLEELKFEEEKNRRRDEFELRKQELELKRMELERDEKLKMYEIKMKYGNKDCSPDSMYYYKI